MSNDLDLLRAALKASPAPDPDARATALRLAMENFDRRQGSRDPARLSQDRPHRAGVLNGVRDMLNSLTTRPALAATASVAALCIALVVAWPQLQPGPQAPDLPNLSAPEVAPPAVVQDEVAELGRSDRPLQGNSAATATPSAPEADRPFVTEALTEAEMAPLGNDKIVALSPEAPKAEAVVEMDLTAGPVAPSQDNRAQLVAPDASAGFAAPAPGVLAQGALPETPMGGFANLPTLQPSDAEAFSTAAANPVHVTAEDPVSTFSVDVDTASYAVIRSSLNAGQLPPPEAVRIEEMVNYFPYAYPAPEAGGPPFTNSVTVMPTPWNKDTSLVHIALQGRLPAVTDRPPLNLVFLIDTSGSMADANRLPLLKQALSLMLSRLAPHDQVAIVAYAGAAGEVLPPTPASDRAAIMNALQNLAAGGATAGAEGLELAYQVAERMKADGRVSRVLLATDGDFNVGIADPEALKTYVAAERAGGTYLSVLGFGRGNLDDATMQALAQNGNGTASYIDTLSEAQKVLADQLSGALFPIADDVKIQVEWNPAEVAEYRLIGYETRALRREDFNNDRVDAGEIGAGLQVTALYEVTAPGSPALLNDTLRYATKVETVPSGELGFLRLRYKEPGQTTSNLIETPITGQGDAPDDARFAAAIAGFGQLLQGSRYLGTWGWDQAIQLASAAKGPDDFGYRAEAVTLMRLAQSLSAH